MKISYFITNDRNAWGGILAPLHRLNQVSTGFIKRRSKILQKFTGAVIHDSILFPFNSLKLEGRRCL